jgi:hypothetical protein
VERVGRTLWEKSTPVGIVKEHVTVASADLPNPAVSGGIASLLFRKSVSPDI